MAALRKLSRITMSRSLSIRGGKAEGDESWGMVVPPTCFTTPCKERRHRHQSSKPRGRFRSSREYGVVPAEQPSLLRASGNH